MISRRAFGLAFAAPVLGWADGSSPLLREVGQRLTAEPVVRGGFEQARTLKGFRNPIVSGGDFVVARGRGVLWRTRQPVASALVVTRDRVLARQADGSVVRRLSAGEEPAVRAVSETLFGMMAADVASLAQRFQIDGQLGNAGEWRLTLVPTDPALGRWLQKMELQGDRFLRGIRLHEASGDETRTRLLRHSTALAMSPEEEAQFE